MPVSVFDVEGTGRKGIRGKSKQKESNNWDAPTRGSKSKLK